MSKLNPAMFSRAGLVNISNIYFEQEAGQLSALLDSILSTHLDDEPLMCTDSIRDIIKLAGDRLDEMRQYYETVSNVALKDDTEGTKEIAQGSIHGWVGDRSQSLDGVGDKGDES